jgi:DNA-binding NarL/FixJ family response regulator
VNPIRVLLADDHQLFRKGVAAALAEQPDFEIVGEAADGREAVAKAREIVPDIVLMDISMPGMTGLEATRQITAELPAVKVVILTVGEENTNLFEAIKGGAQGYLLKDVEPEHLADKLRGVCRGEAQISGIAAAKILAAFADPEREAAPMPARAPLTPRETEILGLVAGGATNKEIASALNLSPSTIKNHLQNILAKLHLENRVQAAAYAVREGLGAAPASADST